MSQDLYAIFAAIVAGMSPAPAFSFGYWPEVRDDLMLKGRDKTKDGTKYPLIVMSTDFEEKRGGPWLAEINPKFYLIEESNKNYSTPERITNVYNTVLYPLYEDFIAALVASKRVQGDDPKNLGQFTHTKKDLYYMGFLKDGVNQNQLADVLDAIELSFTGMRITKSCT